MKYRSPGKWTSIGLSIWLLFGLPVGIGGQTSYSIEALFQAQLAQRDTTQLFQITYPDDSSRFAVSRVRYGAWTRDTTAVVTVNAETIRVYPSGAFSGLLSLQPGWNAIPFRVYGRRASQEKTLHLYRIPPVETLPETPTTILDTLMVPARDVTYYAEDQLVVRFTGSPGGRAAFRVWGLTPGFLPMVELPPERTGGRAGVYEGVYRIQPGDQCRARPVVFRLRGVDGKKVRRKSKARVRVRQTGQPRLVVTTEEYNLVRYAPGGEIFMDLPQGIIFETVADLGAWWKIRVAARRTAYLSRDSGRLLPVGGAVPEAALFGIAGAQDSNWVTIRFRLSERVPFDITQHTDPERVSVTFFRTRFQDEWTVYPYPDSLVDHFDWEQVADDVLRFDVYLNTRQQWGFKGWYEGDRFILALRKPPRLDRENPLRGLTIAVDAGHGGDHRGAVGATGLMEKDVNLVYTHYLAELLREKGARVIITRPDDRTMTLAERMEIARRAQAHLFLWLHNNSTALVRGPFEMSGTSIYYTHLQGWPFARAVYPHLLELDLAPEGEVHRSYYMTRQTDMPVFLVEGAFLSNPEDELFLLQDENLRRLAQAVLDGLEAYLRELAE
jgi:N-acetylmuramoyl-L-alanine amidase